MLLLSFASTKVICHMHSLHKRNHADGRGSLWRARAPKHKTDRGRSKAWFSGCSATREGVLGIFSIEKSTTFVQGCVNSFISLLPTIHFLLLSKGSGGDLSNGRAWTPERGHLWNTPVGTSHSGCLRNAGLLLDLFLASARRTKKNHAHTHTKEKTNKKNPAHWFCN